ncbi:porin [Hydrogenophaga sp. 2FB]|uniref:porin n=1 Tax=Hydrogenophaga sp. 2FB TaxID=2502187 RepID=UPI0010F763BD|nr:porin [Hydrogenophaga sp. 2FB]
MKKSILLLSAFGAACAANAQTSVTLYGVIDVAVTRGNGSVSDRTMLGRGALSPNRFGLRGNEDLGGGMSAGFALEAGYNADDGTGGSTNTNNQNSGVVSGGLVFSRASYLRLGGAWGEVRAGRDYVPQYLNFGIGDPLGLVGAGAALNYTNIITGPTSARASNGLFYYSPSMLGGLVVNLAHYRGENMTGIPTEDDGTGNGIRLSYQAGAFVGGVGWGQTHYAAGDATQRNVAASYDLGGVKLMGMLSRDRLGTLQSRGGVFGAHAKVGAAGLLRAAYSTHRTNAVGTPESKKLALSYVHSFSKRTALYTTVARVSNSGGASVALNGARTGANRISTGWDVGMRHSF